MSSMQFRQLEYFIAAVEEGSITRAADQLHVAQPSLSSQIAALEKEVGGRLLKRHARGVRPTQAGRVLLAEAIAAVSARTRASNAVSEALAHRTGVIQVGVINSLSVRVIPVALAEWRREHPNIIVRLNEYGRTDLEQALMSEVCDVGIGPLPQYPYPVIDNLGTDEFAIILGSDDPLERTKNIDERSLINRDWVLYAPDHSMAGVVELICRRSGFQPRAAVYTRSIDSAVRLAASGIGPAIVPARAVPSDVDVAVCGLRKPYKRVLAAYSTQPFSQITQSFVDVVRLVLEGETGPGSKP